MTNINIRLPYNKLNSITEYSHLDCSFEIVINLEDIEGFDVDYFNNIKLNNFTVHAPFFDVSLGSKNPLVVDTSINILSKVFNICNKIRPLHIVMHHNYQPYVYAFDEADFTSRFYNNFSQVLQSKKYNYRVLFENVFETDPNIGSKLIESFDQRDDLGFCFDVGHFNLFSTVTLSDWILAWEGHISEYHLHNNFGIYDEHNVLNQGTVDVESLISLMCPKILTIENLNSIDSIKSFNLLCKIVGS